MFGLGAKSNVPNSSQYDFKGTTVLKIISLDEATTKLIQADPFKGRKCRNIRRRFKTEIEQGYRVF
jgi:hypothetical protein